MVMKKRSISGCVTVIGPPRRICSWKIGTTLPLEASTLPNRTTTNFVRGDFRKGVHEPLGQVLGHAHHAGGIDRLVGRDHDEFLHGEFVGQLGQLLRAADVVLDRLAGVVLHHRHVLVRGGMEHDVGPMLAENLFQPVAVGDVGRCRE